MEKSPQSDSMTTLTVKPDYAVSDIYLSEPPPVYQGFHHTIIQVTKIIAVSVVFICILLGSFLLASSYVMATASCRHSGPDSNMFKEAKEIIQLSAFPEALIQDKTPYQNQNFENSVNNGLHSNDKSGKKEIFIKMDYSDFINNLHTKDDYSLISCKVNTKHAREIINIMDKKTQQAFPNNVTTKEACTFSCEEQLIVPCESSKIKKSLSSDNVQNDNDFLQIIMIPTEEHVMQQLYPAKQPLMQNEKNLPEIKNYIGAQELQNHEIKIIKPEVDSVLSDVSNLEDLLQDMSSVKMADALEVASALNPSFRTIQDNSVRIIPLALAALSNNMRQMELQEQPAENLKYFHVHQQPISSFTTK